MVIRDARLQARFVVRLAESAAVGELQADEKVVGAAHHFAMAVNECLQQHLDAARSAIDISINERKLIWIRACVAGDRERFAAPNQFATALTEMLPTAD